MITISAADIAPHELYSYLNAAVAPRPVCFASTISAGGSVNLSPYSFFNMMSVNPPVCVFSPLSNRNNEPKHTLLNVREVPEVTINIVDYKLVQQMNLTSGEYAREVDEFSKAGLTPVASQLVKPPRVAEAPVQMECNVTRIIELGSGPLSGNLVIAEVKLLHIREDLMGSDGKIIQERLDLVARLGGDWYCHVNEQSLFKVARPVISIGVDALPEHIRHSDTLTGSELAILASKAEKPSDDQLKDFSLTEEARSFLIRTNTTARHEHIRYLLQNDRVEAARLAAWL